MNQDLTIEQIQALSLLFNEKNDLMDNPEEAILELEECLNKYKEMRKKEKILSQHPFAITQGKDGRYSTYVTDKTKKSGRRLIRKTYLEDLEEAICEFYTNPEEFGQNHSKKDTLKELFPKWLKHKALMVAPGTISRNESDWKRYYANTDLIRMPIQEITKLVIEEWLYTTINEQELTKHQYVNCTSILNQMLDYALDLGLVERNEFKYIRKPTNQLRKERKKEDLTQVFTDSERQAIKEMAWADFESKEKVYELSPLAVLFQFETGVRIGEVCAIQFGDIDSNHQTIHIQRMLRRDIHQVVEHTKTDCGDRMIPLTKEALNLLVAAAKRHMEVFGENVDLKKRYVFSLTGDALPERPIASLYQKYCKRIGCVQKSSHKARKTFISSAIDAGMNINTIRKIAGHADEKTTLNNYCYDKSSQEEKIALLEKALAI